MSATQEHRIRLSGRMLPGADRAQAVQVLGRLLRTGPERAAALLDGGARKLGGGLDAQRAQRVCERLRSAGIDCSVDATRADPPTASAAATATGAGLRQALAGAAALTPATIGCPACGAEQTGRDICTACGVVFEKYHARQHTEATGSVAAPRGSLAADARAAEHWRVVGQLLLLVLLVSIAVGLFSGWRRDQIPQPGFYDLRRLVEPRQTPTGRPPFQVSQNDVVYTIRPVADYVLDGVVVSLHDADAFTDIWHHDDWRDFINIRDLCVVWGGNVVGGVVRDMYFHNGNWTCWAEAADNRVWARFNPHQLSNNHVLADDPRVRRAIKRVRVGDQVRFRGVLAHYAHAGGFSRGTSTTRTDGGNGACETVYIDSLEVLRRPNTGWHLAYRLSIVIGIAALIGSLAVLALAPVARRR